MAVRAFEELEGNLLNRERIILRRLRAVLSLPFQLFVDLVLKGWTDPFSQGICTTPRVPIWIIDCGAFHTKLTRHPSQAPQRWANDPLPAPSQQRVAIFTHAERFLSIFCVFFSGSL